MSETTTVRLIKIAANPALTDHLHAVLGTYCHQVRNHLNSLKLCLYFAKRDVTEESSPWTALNARYVEMELWIERLQLLCRPLRLDLYHLPFDLLIEERRERWTEIARRKGGTLVIEPDESSATLSFDLGRLGQGLDDLAEWRFRNASKGTRFLLHWKREAGELVFRWSEACDEPSEKRMVPETSETSPLSREGLILPLIHRLVALHGGTVDHSVDEGWHLTIRLPSEPRQASETRGKVTVAPCLL